MQHGVSESVMSIKEFEGGCWAHNSIPKLLEALSQRLVAMGSEADAAAAACTALVEDNAEPVVDKPTCRFCWGGEEDTELGPLLRPCNGCKGSVSWVHTACIKAWLSRRGASHCELCKSPWTPSTRRLAAEYLDDDDVVGRWAAARRHFRRCLVRLCRTLRTRSLPALVYDAWGLALVAAGMYRSGCMCAQGAIAARKLAHAWASPGGAGVGLPPADQLPLVGKGSQQALRWAGR